MTDVFSLTLTIKCIKSWLLPIPLP